MFRSLLLLLIASGGTASKGQYECKSGLENLSQGSVRLNKKSFAGYKSKNREFVLAVSDSSCTTCCFTEYLIYNLLKQQKGTESVLKVARVDSNKEFAILEQE